MRFGLYHKLFPCESEVAWEVDKFPIGSFAKVTRFHLIPKVEQPLPTVTVTVTGAIKAEFVPKPVVVQSVETEQM